MTLSTSSAVTRTKIGQCSTKGCPAPDDAEWHQPWCRGIYGHQCFGGATHQHTKKRSQGGKTIDACLCAGMHDAVDNGTQYTNKVLEFDDGERRYRLWDTKTREILIDREIGASTATGEGSRGIELSGVATRTLPAAADASVSVVAPPTSEGGEGAKVEQNAPIALGVGFGDSPTPSPLAPNLADDAGRDSRGVQPPLANTIPRAVTSPSIAESLKPNGLDLPDEFTFSDWTELAKMVTGMNLNRQWWAGDLILAGERFGERATQHWNDLGYKYESLANCVRVCRRFPRPLRHENLSFSHHAVVYKMTDVAAKTTLEVAAEQGWTVSVLRVVVHGEKPRTVRFSVDELRERAAGFTATEHRNHGARFLAAFLESLE